MKILKCPKCNEYGLKVKIDNVMNCTKEYIKNTIEYDAFFACLNKNCNVVYYNDERIIEKEHVKYDFWFKNVGNDYVVCYCYNIKFSDIILSVKKINKKNISVKDVFACVGIKNPQCSLVFPFDNNCYKLFTFVLWYSIKLKRSLKSK